MTQDTKTIQVASLEELAAVASEIANQLSAGSVLLLRGNLGSGKTTFTQALAAALGIKEPVTSPTFTIVGEYEVPARDDISYLVHIDLYRIPGDQHGVDREYIAEVIDTAKVNKRVVVIEWPERLDMTVDNAWEISFELGESETQRILTIIKKRV